MISEKLLEMPFATISHAFDLEMHSLIFDFKGYIYGENIDEQEIVREKKTPKTWWDAFKVSAINDGNPFFNPHKIKYTTVRVAVELKKYWIFPELPKDRYPESLGKPIPFATMYEKYSND